MSMLFALMASKVDLERRAQATIKATPGVIPAGTKVKSKDTEEEGVVVDQAGDVGTLQEGEVRVNWTPASREAFTSVVHKDRLEIIPDKLLGGLETLLADLSAPGYISLQAAPPVAEPPSRGQAPQREDLSERANENLKTLSQPPTAIEHMKKGPKELTKEVARSAPEASKEETALVESAEKLEGEIKSLQDQIAAATGELTKSMGEKKASLITTLNTLYELMDKNGRRVTRLKDKIIAIDEKREVKEANLSPAAKKKVEEIKAKIDRKSEELKALKDEIKDLTAEQFQKYGGTETEQRRVTEAPNPDMKVASLASLTSLVAAGHEKALTIQAGIIDVLKTVWNKLKSVFGGFDEIENDVDELAGLA